MNDKYRIYLKTKQEIYMIARGPQVNGLVAQISRWLKGESGRRVRDSDLNSIEMTELDDNGGLVATDKVPVDRRSQIIKAAEGLGAR